ncbi:MAG: response regulator transcription factor [Nitrospiraceae bacterium]
MAETSIQPGRRKFVDIYMHKTGQARRSKERKMSHQDIHLIRVLIVSDSHIMRSGLRRILESQANIRVLGDVSVEMASAADTILRQHPELVLIDLDPRGNDALGFIGTTQKTSKVSAVLVLSDLADYELACKALALGAAGVVLKIQPPAVLITAIQDLCPPYTLESLPKNLATETKLSKSQNLLNTYTADAENTRKIQLLTTRELEVIRLIALGLKNKDIANRLSISDITVRHHLTSIFCKLEVADRQKLLILAHRCGLADLTSRTESA